MNVLKRCPCLYNNKHTHLYRDSIDEIYEEDYDSDNDYSILSSRSYERNVNTYNLINTSSVDSLKNNWEWLCLKYERRLNEILNIVKNTNNINNINGNNGSGNKLVNGDANVEMFLSFVPNILQDYIRNIIVSNKLPNNYLNDTSSAKLEESDSGHKDKLTSEIDLESLVSNKIIDKKGVMLMFCDITGFTSITNMIEKKNKSKYVSNLGQFLNNFFSPLINIIHYYNGDIIKFSGDAILTIFYPHTIGNKDSSNDNKDRNNKNLVKMALNCLKCCEELHNILNNYPIVLNNNSSSSLTNSVRKGSETPLSYFSLGTQNSSNTVRSKRSDAIRGFELNLERLKEHFLLGENNYSNKDNTSGNNKNEDNEDEVQEIRKLKLHISCTFGDIKMKIVGGIFERYEYYLNGIPLIELGEINNISKSDETIISGNLYNIVKNYIDSIPVESNSNNGKYYYKFISFKPDIQVDEIISTLCTRKLSLERDDVDFYFGENKLVYMKLLSYFIPKYIYKKLMYNVNIYNNEIRKITIIFVNFRIVYNNLIQNHIKDNNSDSSGEHKENYDKLVGYLNNLLVEVIMKVCQKSIYSFEGTLNKLLIDDKGLSFLIFMGFPPFFSEDYTFKSVLLSLNIYNNINKYNLNNNLLINHQFGNRNDNNEEKDKLIDCLSNIKYKINIGVGISTGNVWCGILGNDVRREYTAIGDVVNVSCRLMDYSQRLSEVLSKGSDISVERTKNKNEYYTDNVMEAVKNNDGGDVVKEVDKDNMNEFNKVSNRDDYEVEDNTEVNVENVKIIKDNDIKYNIIMDTNTYNECSKYIEIIKLNPVKLKNKKGLFDIYTTKCRLILNHVIHSGEKEVDGLVGRNSNEIECKDIDLNLLNSLFDGERLLNDILGLMDNNNVVYLEHNDSNGNSLLYGYIRLLIGRYFCNNRLKDEDKEELGDNSNNKDFKVLGINYNVSGISIENVNNAYKELVNGIVGEWSRSTERISNFSSEYYPEENKDNRDNKLLYKGQYVQQNENKNNNNNKDNKDNTNYNDDKKNILKELLDPNLHWDMNVLGNLIEQNLSFDIKQFIRQEENEEYYRNSIVSLLLLGDRVNFTEKNNNNLLKQLGNENIENKDAILDNKLLEKKYVDDYLYSLVEGMNLYHNLILVINTSNVEENNRLVDSYRDNNSNSNNSNNNKGEENKLLCRLIKYAKSDKNINKFMLLIIDGNYNSVANNNLLEKQNNNEKMKLKKLDKKQIKNLLFELIGNKLYLLNKEQQKLLEQQNKTAAPKENNANEVASKNNKQQEELSMMIYNNTNGIYYFVYLYFKYILEYINNEENKLDELMKNLGNLYKNEIIIYFKYKIDLLNNYELFVLKFLVLLNHPISLNKLYDVINFNPLGDEDNKNKQQNLLATELEMRRQEHECNKEKIMQRENNFENKEGIKLILDRLLHHNLVTYEENNKGFVSKEQQKLLKEEKQKQKQQNDETAADNNLLEKQNNETEERKNNINYVVRNKILKEIVNDMIPSEEKLHIVNNYLIHF